MAPRTPHAGQPGAHRANILASTSRLLFERLHAFLQSPISLRLVYSQYFETNRMAALRVQRSALAMVGKARVLGCCIRATPRFSLLRFLPPHLRMRVLMHLGPDLAQEQLRHILSFACDRRTIGHTAYRKVFISNIRLEQDSTADLKPEHDAFLHQKAFSFLNAYVCRSPRHQDYFRWYGTLDSYVATP